MRYFCALIFGVSASLITACNGSGDGVITKSFENFSGEVVDSLSSNAVNCGFVEIGENDIDANTCVAESFNNELEFYAVYKLQGIDSTVGAAITRENDGVVYLWSYDSNPAGGIPASSSVIDKEECIDAEFSGTVDNGYSGIFFCN